MFKTEKRKLDNTMVTTIPGSTVFNSYSNVRLLSIPAVYACINLISETIATLPLETKIKGLKVPDHIKTITMLEPIDNMTFPVWVNTIVRNLFLDGNAFAEIRNDQYIIHDKIQVQIHMDELGDILFYTVGTKKSKNRKILKEDMLHFKRITKDERGQVGLSIEEAFQDLIQMIKATDDHAADYMRNGLMSGLWLEIKGRVQPEVLTKIRDKFKGLYQGVANRQTIPTLTDGMQLHELKNNTLKDSSLEVLKGAQLKDIAMIFNVPITLLDGSQGNYGSTVEANLMFLKACINPILKNIESELNLKLNYGSNANYFFDTSAYLTGTFNQQIETLARSVDAGILTPNEARARLGYKDLESGSKLYAPAGTPGTPDGARTSTTKEKA